MSAQESMEHAEHAELDIGDADLPIDAAVHHRLVDTDRQPRSRPRHADKTEDAACAVKVLCGRRAFVFRQQLLGQLVTGKVLADQLPFFGGSGKHCAAAVDDKDLRPRTLCRTAASSPIHRRSRDATTTDVVATPPSFITGNVTTTPGMPLTRLMR